MKALNDGRFSLLFDGLDEVSRDHQIRVTADLKDFARRYSKCQLVVTSRDAVYRGELAPEFGCTVGVADFDDVAIRRLLKRWPRLTDPEAGALFAALQDSPALMRLAVNPLMLTMIAYLHSEVFSKTGRTLPTSRPAFYEIAIDHLLRRDRELVRHGAISVYDSGDKKAVLQRVALALQEAPIEQADRKSISRPELIEVVKGLLPDLNLDPQHATLLIDEIVDRSQLLIRLDRFSSRYSFRHLTLQEYLAANELAADPDGLLKRYEADPAAWRETVKLWCGVSDYSTKVVSQIFERRDMGDYALALECLAEVKRINDEYATLMIGRYLKQLGHDERKDLALVRSLAAVAADARPRGRHVFDSLSEIVRSSDPRRASALNALAQTRLPKAAAIIASIAHGDTTARAALRSMGEQAVPALRDKATTGDMTAIDDLAAIRTPSAAQAVTSFLWEDGELAERSAWWLASLIRNPDVEAEVKVFHGEARGLETLDWVWAPFAPSGSALSLVMGRVAHLLAASPTQAIPEELTELDARLAIPLGLVGRSPMTAKREWGSPPTHIRELAALVVANGKASEPNRLTPSQYTSVIHHGIFGSWSDVARILSNYLYTDTRQLSLAVLDHQNLPTGQRQILRLMPEPVQVAAAIHFSSSDNASVDHWKAVRNDVSRPKALRRGLNILLGFMSGTIIVLVIYGLVAVLARSEVWFPSWLAWTAVGGLGMGMLYGICHLLSDLLTGRSGLLGFIEGAADTVLHAVDNAIGKQLVVAGAFVLCTVGGGLWIAAFTAASLISWPSIIAISGVFSCISGVIAKLIIRREHAAANPLRTQGHCVVVSRWSRG